MASVSGKGPVGRAKTWGLLAGVASFLVLTGCYRHVVSAKGPGASQYETQQPASENTPIVSDLKAKPKPTLTKGGKPVED